MARLALGLPGVELGTSWGTPGLKVKGRFLARLKEDGETLVLRIGFTRREQLMAREPAVFYVTDHYMDYPAVLIRLPKVGKEGLTSLLKEAWTEVAPERLVAGHTVPARRPKGGAGQQRDAVDKVRAGKSPVHGRPTAPAKRSRMASRYVALIRGINVGRAKRVAMADLRALLAELGYGDVGTILNSGNVVFSASQQQPSSIGQRIERAMAERLGVSGRTTVLTAAAFARVTEENPLAKVATDPARLLVAFCSDPGRLKNLDPLKRQDWAPEAMVVGSLAAYLWCAEGILASRLLEAVSRALGESTTTRNWSTVGKLHAALQLESATTKKAARRGPRA